MSVARAKVYSSWVPRPRMKPLAEPANRRPIMNSIARPLDPSKDARADAPVGWGAAIIDEQGNEVPITESMISRACEELARTWVIPRSQAATA